ncbi:MAG: alpha/beta hydrolase [Thermodesulfovibrionales bacterium]
MSEGSKRMLTTIAIGLFLGYIAIMALVYVGQKGMVYFPIKEISITPSDIGLMFEDVTLTTEDGKSISAWYIPADNARGVLLFCHGNAGNISHRLDSIRIFHDLDLSVLIFDYRGYGNSNGSPSEKGTYYDAEAAWNYLVGERYINPGKIILFGRSLGGAVASMMAVRHRPGALIIESGFTSVPDIGKKLFPFLPVRLISRYDYNARMNVQQVNIPKLFIHSPDDEIIAYEHGRKLFESATGPKDFLQITGDHNYGFLNSGKLYTEGLDRFISNIF